MTPSVSICVVVAAAVAAMSCGGNAPDRTTAEGAFAGLSVCLESSSDECLLHQLDKGSRDSLWAVFAMTRDIRSLISTHYPDSQKDRPSLPTGLFELVKSDSAEKLFSVHCGRTRCALPIRETFGAIADKKVLSDDEVDITTVRGGVVRMRRVDGEWGLAVFGDVLQSERDRVRRNLTEVRKNAAAYEEQRQAAGSP